MSSPRQPLFQRLPEIYRIKDGEQTPPGQLEAFLGAIEEVYAALHARTDAQYHDLFIEHCDDWVVAYLADLLGTSRLSGDPWTLRADVARTVFHRRRKGTLGAVESQVFTLSGWAAHAVEMRERLAWTQHLNHQRPDNGAEQPLTLRPDPGAPVRGGTVALRDPARLALIGGAFDPFARVADVKPPTLGMSGWNLPNLAVLLWRLAVFQTPLARPRFRATVAVPAAPGAAALAVRFDAHPQGEPWPLFNTHRFHADDDPPRLGHEDEVPGPMIAARLTTDAPDAAPASYVAVQVYDDPRTARPGDGAVGLVLHLPQAAFADPLAWRFRGANLCAWETALAPPLRANEVAIDPERGRLVFGVADADPNGAAKALQDGLLVSATHALAGPCGAQAVPRADAPAQWPDDQTTPTLLRIDAYTNADALRDALADLPSRGAPLIIEIADSLTHRLDLSTVVGIGDDGGLWSLRLAQPLWIRAASGERPLIRLVQPLRARPTQIGGSGAPNLETLALTLEGLYLTRDDSFPPTDALLMQAALGSLSLIGCTLDPGGGLVLDGSVSSGRAPIRDALRLGGDFGLGAAAAGFDQVPTLSVERCISGPLAIDSNYLLSLTDTIVDAGSGVAATTPALAIAAAGGDPETGWGPDLRIAGVTVFGRTRVQTARGEGGLFVHALQVHDNQDSHTADVSTGSGGSCLKFCWFANETNRLPQHFGCLFGADAPLRFTAERFGRPGYAQLRPDCDARLRNDGPGSDEMGAFGFLLNTHRWKNIGIRLREFTPVGVRPLLIPIT